MTPTEAAIRAAILECPDDDLHRLALADWLQEQEGEAQRAEGTFVAASMAYGNTSPSSLWMDLVYAEDELERLTLQRPYSLVHDDDESPFLPDGVRFGYWRGLPHAWAVADVPTFEAEARDVFSRWPIRRVVLRCEVGHFIGKRPHMWDDDCSPELWAMLSGEVIADADPEFDLKEYDTAASARADLEACLARHGRTLAGLPTL